MAWADERGLWLARNSDALFLKNDALILAENCGPGVAAGTAIANSGRNILDLVAMWLALKIYATEPLECFQKECGDKMRLQPVGGGAFHLFAYLAHAHHVHHFTSEGAFFQQGLQVLAVKRLVNNMCQLCPHIGAVSIANGLHNQVTQGAIVELDFAQYIKDLASQRLALLL